MAAPRPREAPVTSATRPLRSNGVHRRTPSDPQPSGHTQRIRTIRVAVGPYCLDRCLRCFRLAVNARAGHRRRFAQNTIFIASWMSRGRFVWLVTLPKSALVGSVFGFAYTARLKALSSSIWNCAADAVAQADLLDDRDVPQVQLRAAQAVGLRREVAHVVRQPDARVGALLDRIVHAVGLNRGVVEVEAADVEHRVVGVARVVGLQAGRVAVEVDVAGVQVDRLSALQLSDRLQAPAADERIGEPVRVRGKRPPVAERQLPGSR